MSSTELTLVRVYLTEGQDGIDDVIHWLEKDSGVHGFTLFRGIAGLGNSGHMHTASLLDLSSSLPLVFEFFDKPDSVSQILEQLQTFVDPDHIISWPVTSGI
ncbi:MAG: DUF190 domain-containing protein [Gammaproteobacteria bacterium]|nr:DUF190 domain-containing protein [Gammaproteobacteria bacterium]